MTQTPKSRIRTLPTTMRDLADMWLDGDDPMEIEAMIIEAQYDPDLPFGPMMDILP